MMKLLINGIIPRANSVPCERDPPVIALMTFKNDEALLPFKASEIILTLSPGTGIKQPIR